MEYQLARFRQPPKADSKNVPVAGFLIWVKIMEPILTTSDDLAFGASNEMRPELPIVETAYLHENNPMWVRIDEIDILDARCVIHEPMDYLEWFARGGEWPKGGT